MDQSLFVIALALLTLTAFVLGGFAERRRVRRAWERGEKTYLGERNEAARQERAEGPDIRR